MDPKSSWVLTSLRKAGWAPIAFFLLHLVIAEAFDAYESWPWLDIPMHAFGGVAISYFFWTSITSSEAEAVLGKLTLFGQFLFSLVASGSAAAIWELSEWSSDYLGWSNSQAGVADTMLDMLLGMIGGLAFLILATRHKAMASNPSDIAD